MIVTFYLKNGDMSSSSGRVNKHSPKRTAVADMKKMRRSKLGCLPCKIRKKKCDEQKPVCGDCSRLSKECTWIDYENMLEDEIKNLREKTREEESKHKLRQRRPKKDPAVSEATTVQPSPATSHIPYLPTQTNTPQIAVGTPPQPDTSALDLDYDDAGSRLPLAFLLFLKDLTNYQPDQPRLTEVYDEGEAPGTTEDQQIRDIVKLPSFLSLMELFSYDPVTSSYNHLNASNSLSLSQSNYHNFVAQVNQILTPLLTQEPSYMPDLILGTANYLYSYYVETLSQQVLIAPNSQDGSNSYQKVFLPLAHKNQGVLYAILGWAGFHLGGEWQVEGAKYTEMAIEQINKELFNDPVTDISHPLLQSTSLAKMDRDQILVKLATLLILCGSEICRGDVKNWSIFLKWGWKLLAANGGILQFNKSKEEHWLISNFAYHDLLLSLSNERGTYFDLKEYDEIFLDKQGWSRGSLNPLLGVAKRLIRIIGDILTLLYDSKRLLNSYYNRDLSPFHVSDDDVALEGSEHGMISRLLLLVIEKAKHLETEIENCVADPLDLVGLTDEEMELQLTMFEAFQISAKLFLKQLIMKCNPLMLECQVLNNDLIKCLDILVGTGVQLALVFPWFMAGIHLVTPHDRNLMRKRLDNFSKHYGMWNVSRAKYVMERVWEQNLHGNNVVDWYAILKDLDWDISFA